MSQISEAEKHAMSGQVVISSEVLRIIRDQCDVIRLSKDSFRLISLAASPEVVFPVYKCS